MIYFRSCWNNWLLQCQRFSDGTVFVAQCFEGDWLKLPHYWLACLGHPHCTNYIASRWPWDVSLGVFRMFRLFMFVPDGRVVCIEGELRTMFSLVRNLVRGLRVNMGLQHGRPARVRRLQLHVVFLRLHNGERCFTFNPVFRVPLLF